MDCISVYDDAVKRKLSGVSSRFMCLSNLCDGVGDVCEKC